MSEMDDTRVEAARAGDQAQFRALTEPYRRELTVHAYRMLGSFEDAEDVVQETFLRAWRRLETFDGRAPFRAWLYRIATNAAIDAIERRPRRQLHPEPGQATGDFAWLGPLPDAALAEPSAAGEDVVHSTRESVALAFVVALQHLPARQRAVLLLRDVIGFAAVDVAELLDFTVPAVNSALQRARATLAERRGPPPSLPDDGTLRALLARYVQAWAAGDVDGLVALLKEDATLAMPPLPHWFTGREAIAAALRTMVFAQPGAHVRMTPLPANGQPGFACYVPRPEGGYAFAGVHVVTVDGGAISHAVSFLDPTLAARFGVPAVSTD